MPVIVPSRPSSGARVISVPRIHCSCSAALQLVGGAELHRPEQRAVGVEQAVVDGAEERVAGVRRQLQRPVEFAGGDGVEALLQGLGPRPPAQAPPPQGALEDDGERRQQGEEDRPHDRAALKK